VTEVPSPGTIAEVLEGFVMSLFPLNLGPPGLNPESIDHFVNNTLLTSFTRLTGQIARGLQSDVKELSSLEAEHRAEAIIAEFARQLPGIRGLLVTDLRAAQQRAASADTLPEILICYPSSRAIIHYRLAHALYCSGVRLVGRIISATAQWTTGIDIHPGARIGVSFFINQGMGVVIGETSVLGENVCLHQGVTLGEGDETPKKRAVRHPIVENNVVIHAGASILGRITIGAGSIIGGNVWLTRSVPPGSVVNQVAHASSTVNSLD
jgi:serine O-acetyltransferase